MTQNLCQQGQGSEFVLTGKGGIASSPSQSLDGDINQVGLVEPVIVAEDEKVKRAESAEAQRSREVEEEIIEAQRWIVNDRGTLELVANQTNFDRSSRLQSENSDMCY